MKATKILLAAAALALASKVAADDFKKSTRDLAKILGEWSFEDASADGSGSYRETGTRSCAYTLEETYIRCESRGRSAKGKDRIYLFYFNYNAADRRYEMHALHSSWSQTQRFTLSIEADGSWRLLRPAAPNADGGASRSNWGTVRFPDANSMVWETRLNSSDEAPDKWVLAFIDTSVRIRR